jgi:hypothetical protein
MAHVLAEAKYLHCWQNCRTHVRGGLSLGRRCPSQHELLLSARERAKRIKSENQNLFFIFHTSNAHDQLEAPDQVALDVSLSPGKKY